MSAEAEMNRFIKGGTGYITLNSGDTAEFDPITSREINAIECIEDATVEVKQYGNFSDGDLTLVKGQIKFGKFYEVVCTTGKVDVYSSGGDPTPITTP